MGQMVEDIRLAVNGRTGEILWQNRHDSQPEEITSQIIEAAQGEGWE